MSQIQKSDNPPGGGMNLTPIDQKMLQALIDSVLVARPGLEGQLTAAAIWQYLQMPDSVYGWSAEGPLPQQLKISLIITTLQLGFTPGMGQVILVGNKPYITAAARATIVKEADEVEVISGQNFRPFSDAEKAMFGIKDGDLHCVVSQVFLVKGRELEWIGHGVVGADELSFRGKHGDKKPGLKTVKDTMQTLKTRAISDMYRRNYPVCGFNDSEGAGEFEQTTTTISATISAKIESPEADQNNNHKIINIAEKKAPASQEYEEARERFTRIRNQISAIGKSADEILGEDIFSMLASGSMNTERLHDSADALESWLSQYKEKTAAAAKPKPEPAPAAVKAEKPAVEPAPQEPKLQKRAGRPTRYQSRFRTLENTATEDGADVAAIIGADPLEVYLSGDNDRLNIAADRIEKWIVENEEKKTAAVKPAELAPVPEWMPQPEAIADIVDEGNDPWDDDNEPADPLAATEDAANDIPIEEPEEEEDLPSEVYLGTLEQKEILKAATQKNGLHAWPEGQHLLAIKMHGRPMSELPIHVETLLAAKPKDEPKLEAEQKPQMPTSGPGLAAYRMIEKFLDDTSLSAAVRKKIIDVAGRKLRDGDHLYLPKAIREAKAGNYADLNTLINDRAAR